MRYLPLLSLFTLLCTASATAAVYKQVDADGNVVFTDVPTAKGEKPHEVAPAAMTYTPTVKTLSPSEQSAKPKDSATQYNSLSIVEPVDNAVIRANGGEFTVSLNSEPKLDADAKHRYIVLVDGQQSQESSTASFTVSGVDRGPHSIQAQILDEQNRVVASSESISVEILRHSVLFPKAKAR